MTQVTPGSVASSGIGAGDVILKIGNLNSTGLAHVEAQELIKGAGNILQLTIKKGAAPAYVTPTETPTQMSYNDSTTAFTPIKDNSRAFSPLQSQVFSPTRTPQQPFSPTRTPSGAFSPVSNSTARPFSPEERTTRPTMYSSSNQYNSSPTSYGMSRQDSRGAYQSPTTPGSRPTFSESSYNTPVTVQSNYRPPYGSQTSNQDAYGDSSNRFGSRNVGGGYQTQSGMPSVTPSYNDSSSYSSYTPPSRSPYTSSGYQSDNIRQQPADISYRSQDSEPYGHQNSPNLYEPYKMSEQYRNYPSQQPPSDQYSSYGRQITPTSQNDSYRRLSSQHDSERSPPSEHSDAFSRQYSGQYDSYSPQSEQYRPPVQPPPQNDGYSEPSYHPYQPSSYNQQSSVRSPQPTDSYQPYSPHGGSQRNSGFSDALTDFSSTFDSMSAPGYSGVPGRDQDTRYPDVSYGRQYSGPRKSDYTDCPPGSSGYAPAPPPAGPAPPPPPPPPPAPPPPPPDWKPSPSLKSSDDASVDNGAEGETGGKKLPDCITNSMNKKGTAKPFAYIPGGVDLKEMREKRKQRMRPSDSQKNYQTMPASMKNKEKKDLPQQRSISPPSAGSENYSKYMSPYSKEQAQMTCTSGGGGQAKKNVDAINSEVLKLIQENDSRGRRGSGGSDPNKQSASFRMLQKMTDTDAAEEGEGDAQANNSRRQRKLLRHNSDDDEMRFSGLHPVTEIPSKSFQRLQKLSLAEKDNTDSNSLKVSDNDEQVGKYDETSIRYKGKFIPSPSFRVLQTWAELDPDKNTTTDRCRTHEEDDDLPETLDPDECKDVRYVGGNIPSKVFKKLQLSVGEDPAASGSDTNEPDSASKQKAVRSIKVVSRNKPEASNENAQSKECPPGITDDGATDF